MRWKEKFKAFEWLTISNTGLSYSVCNSINYLGSEKGQILKLMRDNWQFTAKQIKSSVNP